VSGSGKTFKFDTRRGKNYSKKQFNNIDYSFDHKRRKNFDTELARTMCHYDLIVALITFVGPVLQNFLQWEIIRHCSKLVR